MNDLEKLTSLAESRLKRIQELEAILNAGYRNFSTRYFVETLGQELGDMINLVFWNEIKLGSSIFDDDWFK